MMPSTELQLLLLMVAAACTAGDFVVHDEQRLMDLLKKIHDELHDGVSAQAARENGDVDSGARLGSEISLVREGLSLASIEVKSAADVSSDDVKTGAVGKLGMESIISPVDNRDPPAGGITAEKFDVVDAAVERSSNASSAAVNAVIVSRCWELLIELVGDLTQLSPANAPKDSASNLVATTRHRRTTELGDTQKAEKKEPEGLPLIRNMLATIAELEYNLIAFDLVHMFPPGPTKTASLPTPNDGQVGVAKVDQPSVAAVDDSASRSQVNLRELLKRLH